MAEKKKRLTFTKIFHYPAEDPDCNGDYCDIELQDSNKKVIATFGSYYDDKGEDKLAGFIEGVEYALNVTVKVVTKNISDR
ncbi:MAG: hypothetical protein ACD_61C00153G0001 [uncultured bacterium]|nr:MAG: hypothetical protein ACD_61C00153G0001 [uncultured bacterium]